MRRAEDISPLRGGLRQGRARPDRRTGSEGNVVLASIDATPGGAKSPACRADLVRQFSQATEA